jgi:uncharacterized protein YyaL (SSP411 family)
MTEPGPANALAHCRSAYLRSAAHQPVAWREWSDAAFDQSRREDKPILLDIGAVWCHWCHVMDRESYENVDIAVIINEHYVPIKVDRDERPDIDARYQTAISAITGQGGWPLTAFLTPDGSPFYGGTYFPPEDRFGRPGMRRLLESVAHEYRRNRAEIHASAEKISGALAEIETVPSASGQPGRAVLLAMLANIGKLADRENGGFGKAPKFPHPSAMELLIDAYLETRETWMLNIITTTLEKMGRGGVYDQLAGGFHRYSVDERWIVPHFEKMSYDNAPLLLNYLHAYQITRNEFFREIAEGILAFIENVLSHPDGGFYASQDADYSLEDDGDYFTWTLEELQAALDPLEAQVAAQYYHVGAQGEMHHNPAKNVLFIDQPIEAIAARLNLKPEEVRLILARARGKMLEARSKRPTPVVDKTIYASWNGMMVSALLETYKVLGLEGVRDRALMTLDVLLSKSYDPHKGMYHSLVNDQAEIEGLLDDQVFVANALVDAFEVSGETRYFETALALMETAIRRFWDEQGGGFFDTAQDLVVRQGALGMKRKPFQDTPTPGGNPAAALVLDRLASLADRPDFRAKAETILSLLAGKAADYGMFAATYGLALANHLREAVEVVIVGDPLDARTRSLLHTAYAAPRAGKSVLRFSPAQVKSAALPKGLRATLPNLSVDGEPVALLCEGKSCQPPVKSPDALAKALAGAGSENPQL